MYLQDLELPPEFLPLIQQHESFFSNPKRINDLKTIIEPEDRESIIRLKMLCILCGCETEWEKVLYTLFAEAFKNKEDKYKAIEKFGLGSFLWETIENKYKYKLTKPGIKDFLLQLLQDNFERSIPSGEPKLNKEAYLFVNRWKENIRSKQIFNDWSLLLEKDLDIENHLQQINVEKLLEADSWSAIDKKLIIALRDHIINNTLPNHTLQEWIEKRKVKFFYTDYAQIYLALSNAATLLDEIRKMNLTVQNLNDGFSLLPAGLGNSKNAPGVFH